MIRLSSMLARDLSPTAPCNLRMIVIAPPVLRLLGPGRMRPSSFLASIILHVFAITLFLSLSRLFPTPLIVVQEDVSKATVLHEPLILPQLRSLGNESSASTEKKLSESRAALDAATQHFNPPPSAPDFTAPQTVISDVAKPVNRIQTILRPDLITPPNLKFPLRLQTVVIVPAAPAPILAPLALDEATQPVLPAEQVAPSKRSVEAPVLTVNLRTGSMIRCQTVTERTVSPKLGTVSGTQANALKALVVLNAVNVAPDMSVPIPEAQLAGKFVVGPSTEVAGPTAASRSTNAEHEARPDSVPTHTAGARASTLSASGEPDSQPGESELSAPPKPETGRRTGALSAGGSTPGGSNPNTGAPEISISGGMSGSSRVPISRPIPRTASYPLMVISGGSSGGSSRDFGVFSRSETVYSVSIPMADAGGGPDWTMQYALLNPVQAGAGLLVPPLAQKKFVAAMKASPASTDAGPVFISAVIDENGKLRSPKSIHARDPRSQVALSTLAQWEFLPAQLDGKPVASKILLGIAVIAME